MFYKVLLPITKNDYETIQDITKWCDTACVGDTYTFRDGIINILF